MSKILLVCVFISLNNQLIQNQNVLTEAFSQNNGRTLSNYFNQNIDLELPESKGIYNKQQAKLILNEFFKKNPISSFQLKHEGGDKEKSLFQIGSLVCKSKKYRTYILYNMVEEVPQIIELRIEIED